MDLKEYLDNLNKGLTVQPGSEMYAYMNAVSQEAMRITMELNTSYHTPEEIRELFSRLTGKKVDDSFGMFPPFYTDCGKNIEVGKHVFINSGCRFQDQGGIRIDDGAFIGHNVVLATLNHDFSPDRRAALYPAPIHIGRNVWIGANVTVLPGVTIGDHSVIAAGAVVSKDIPENVVAAGVPARVVKTIKEAKAGQAEKEKFL
ncbi:Putative acetyltransferase SA2342 [uncultured Roseburia sp.]|uniref:Sugar O-acetyltransferase n=1 Tax=Brotonthovivens ammoniilytica TaxID=2981725 RepID=A0ABT2TMD1_9FIRM|nr:sugar O-acetyltransferase [Brotonthovivens ammoniilytica]MCU6763363.1 sugar O-acetyltransferase [Brotonthovivens ammoniilytica]SCJ14987.1 Putative acetyltransferase SA2342 [uncultured Roseburia sp.]